MDKLTKEYLDTVEKVKRFDTEAANYLLLAAPLRNDFDVYSKSDLYTYFIWKNTPQGHRYWKYIADELERQ